MNENISITNNNGTDAVVIYPQGVCSKQIHLEISNGIIEKAKFVGGCAGNTQGVSSLIIGLSVEQVIEKLNGIRCGSKPTSCPDQLAQGLNAYLIEKSNLQVGV